jgi:hypothetical protein
MSRFKQYAPRKVEFQRLADAGGWDVKVYTITCQDVFASHEALDNAVANLPKWLEKAQALDFETYKIAFLIVHEGRDGIWSILFWWIGENMLQSVTFSSHPDKPREFTQTPKEGGMVCVWEIEVINFERLKWVEHILRQPDSPDFSGYLSQQLNGNF